MAAKKKPDKDRKQPEIRVKIKGDFESALKAVIPPMKKKSNDNKKGSR